MSDSVISVDTTASTVCSAAKLEALARAREQSLRNRRAKLHARLEQKLAQLNRDLQHARKDQIDAVARMMGKKVRVGVVYVSTRLDVKLFQAHVFVTP